MKYLAGPSDDPFHNRFDLHSECFCQSEGKTRAHHRTIGFSGIVMSLFILLQCQYPLMPFYSIGCLLATCTIHSFVYKDEMLEHFKEMEVARRMAFRDPLEEYLGALN